MRPLIRTSATALLSGVLLGGSVLTPMGGPVDFRTVADAEPAPVVHETPRILHESIVAELAKRTLTIEPGDLRRILGAVERSSARFGIDALTILAVIDVESGFNPYAVSPVGAAGLMQLRAETATEIAAQLGIPWTSEDLLFDPETNVLLGTCYLKQLLVRFGSIELALAAFHVGPTRIASRNLELGTESQGFTRRVWSAQRAFHETGRV